MHYIYHIPGLKIGCTSDPKTRARRPHYEGFYILEVHEDAQTAGDRELELQREYGYPVDTDHYLHSHLCGKRGGSNSHIKGTSLKQKEQLAVVRNPQRAADARTRIKCKHCNVTGLTGNINRWHNDNCKHKQRE